MKIQKSGVIVVVGIIFFSFFSLAIVGRTSQTFEEEKLSYLGDDKIEDILPQWITEGEIPLVPALIIFSGILLFIIFVLALYRKKRRIY